MQAPQSAVNCRGGLACHSGCQCLEDRPGGPALQLGLSGHQLPRRRYADPLHWRAHCAHSMVSGKDQRQASSLVLLKEEWL